ncbi:Serine/threonine-protein phosphatase 4 regulatory subunit 1 [Lonchura striata]|uniref:Serine/threonine-protein phosphatase 4 regulatory subunit 1 n=1 Tax=Lonchura striata TaxID=40157 RepID=A0A218UZ94_9PASE|nr:serine/threonine-protein phosphatase 4 regulatory subunit 1 isoform X1 [Lonchura striata domestica]OWK59087.1 Serine/threonine-protein phosphatase 4 regulatory subunit 1 [Lonchura striata domestica]
MAGIPLYFVDLQDDLDDFGFEDYGPDCDSMRITAFLDIPGQDNLTPLARLEKYAFSDNVFNRQIIARGLLDVFRDFSNNEEDFLTVMEIVVRLSEDAEPTVRTELMEQIPPIAIFLQESRPKFPTAFFEYLMPIVVRYLTDVNNQVRKAGQEALLILLEQDLVAQSDIENKVCPILLDLSAPDSDDEYKVEAVNIICKMASMLSRTTVEHMLLPRFCELCSDGKLFQVRKICAANFGDICNAVGQEATERLLIPKFFELCSDSVWGMRKACAECFMAVSYTTSPEVRRSKLSPLFISLISDTCRWVRQAAFQSLGPFISTFANPSSAGLYIREDGTLSIRPPAQDVNFNSCQPSNNITVMSSSANAALPSSEQPMEIKPESSTEEASAKVRTKLSEDLNKNSWQESSDCCASPGEDVSGLCQGDKTAAGASGGTKDSGFPGLSSGLPSAGDVFSTFLYWRSPLPDISQDLELLQFKAEKHNEACSVPCNNCVASSEIKKVLESLQEHIDDPDVQAQVQVLSAALRAAQFDSVGDCEAKKMEESGDNLQNKMILDETTVSGAACNQVQGDTLSSPASQDDISDQSSTSVLKSTGSEEQHRGTSVFLRKEQENNPSLEDDKSKLQDIIPQPLLDQYLSMTDPARAQTVDTEIAKHCAYSLPGVALTLGRQNWHCLKDTYETLASDVQWKVRRTLAFSIHELAVILGDQLTAADLVPIFNGFLKDLDEVRIGVLKHLYDFLKLLHADKRREYLYQLQEFVVTDNSRNWRFRYELAEQLILILELYNPNDVFDYLRHIALTLCSDKVSEVRWISFKLVVAILQKFYANSANGLGLNFINELVVRFRHCSKWVGRQAFAFICQAVVEEECMPVDQFVEHLLPSLLSLASDPVPNVRVLLAKALRQTLLEKAYFKSVGNPHLEAAEETILALQSDRDQDVSFFATIKLKQDSMDNITSEKQN